jgi:uncharacterized protein GlcG (DUF336 family)
MSSHKFPTTGQCYRELAAKLGDGPVRVREHYSNHVCAEGPFAEALLRTYMQAVDMHRSPEYYLELVVEPVTVPDTAQAVNAALITAVNAGRPYTATVINADGNPEIIANTPHEHLLNMHMAMIIALGIATARAHGVDITEVQQGQLFAAGVRQLSEHAVSVGLIPAWVTDPAVAEPPTPTGTLH